MARVCVDAMGGDELPEVVLAGITQALEQDSSLEVLVAGQEDLVVPFCDRHERACALVTTEVIGMEEHPTEAVRHKKDSSIVKGCRAVREGEADAFFSAGSTGAILSAGTLIVGRLKGVSRACLASALPGVTPHHMTTFLDLGANADCTPEMLVQFARMGSAYSKVVIGIDNPCVALLSNGTEDTKGSAQVIATHALLKEAKDLNFVGNCEGRDILCGGFDVVVTDGMSGNIALKTLEGTAKFILSQLKSGAKQKMSIAAGALLVKPVLSEVGSLLSGDQFGGAALLGLKAPVLVGHGATNPEAIKNGTLTAARCVTENLCAKMADIVSNGD